MIKWPKEWDNKEGWGTSGQSPLSVLEFRRWSSLTVILSGQGITRLDRIEALGGPTSPSSRSIESLSCQIRSYYEKHGRRPSASTSQLWGSHNQWLANHHDLSLTQLCTNLGIPEVSNRTRSLADVETEIRSYYKKHGERPSVSIHEWGIINAWLANRHDTTLRKVCDALGLPIRFNLTRTRSLIRKEIRAYYSKHKRRPFIKASNEWQQHDAWLARHHDSSLFKECNLLHLPGGFFTITVREAQDQAKVYYKKKGRRPSKKTSEFWAKVDGALVRYRTTLAKACDAAGIPGAIKNWTLQEVKDKIRGYLAENGTCPKVNTSKEWQVISDWAKNNHGMSLKQLRESMGLDPPRVIHTFQTVKVKIQDFYDTHARRPLTLQDGSEWQSIASWLYSQESSLKQVCDTLKLKPNRRRSKQQLYDQVA